MLQLLQMVESYEPAERDTGPGAEPVAEGPEMVDVAGGEVEIGAVPAASPTTMSARAMRSSWRRS